jgi:hypothetical protein
MRSSNGCATPARLPDLLVEAFRDATAELEAAVDRLEAASHLEHETALLLHAALARAGSSGPSAMASRASWKPSRRRTTPRAVCRSWDSRVPTPTKSDPASYETAQSPVWLDSPLVSFGSDDLVAVEVIQLLGSEPAAATAVDYPSVDIVSYRSTVARRTGGDRLDASSASQLGRRLAPKRSTRSQWLDARQRR